MRTPGMQHHPGARPARQTRAPAHHASAACNIAERAMGMLAEATLPPTHGWLPKSMTVNYLAKAETSLTAVAELPSVPEFGDEGFELPVPVTITDTHDTPVVTVTFTDTITPEK